MSNKVNQYTSINKTTIFQLLLKNKYTLRKYGVKKIGLFGSFARNEQNSGSDIDFLVAFEEGKKNFHNFINLVYFLEDLLGRKIELVTEESLSPYLGPRIVKEVEYATL
jgi:predicted nucleotidyltransferase